MKENRIEYLDSLRGLASISVVISHFVLAYRLDLEFRLINYSPLHFFYDGFAAVTFFFVLSGYVLTLSMRNKVEIELKSFYLKRIFRIMPAYIFVLFTSLLFYSFFNVIHTIPDTSSWINSFWSKPLNFINFIKQIVFITPENGYAELVFQNWSLFVEMQFSFLIPFLFLIYKKSNFIFFLVFNLILYFFFNIPVYIFHFSLGIALAMNQDYILTIFTRIKTNYKMILIFFIIFMYTYRYTLPMYYYYFLREYSVLLSNDDLIWIITGLGSFLILLYCFTSTRLQKMLNLHFFRFIGKISYAIYLTHLIVLIFVIPIFINYLNHIGIINSSIIWILSLLFLLFITTIFSYFLTTFVEVPIAKFGNNMIKKYISHKNS
jgi:peptidoglycan/LPS O-acetylase OafA/YrhL